MALGFRVSGIAPESTGNAEGEERGHQDEVVGIPFSLFKSL